MRNRLILASALILMGAPAFADINTGNCSSPLVQRDVGPTATTIFFSTTTSAGTYRVCSLSSTIQITVWNTNGTQTVLPLTGQSCIDVSSTEITLSATPKTTGNSVIYCKAGS